MYRKRQAAPSRTITRPYRRHAGLSLVEISLALAVVGVSTAFVARTLLRDNGNLLARSEALTLTEIQTGLQTYLNTQGLHLVTTPTADVEHAVTTSSTGQQTVTLTAGTSEGQSYWPRLQQLQTLGMIPLQQDFKSRIHGGLPYTTGPIALYSAGDDETPLNDTSGCLRDGCILRIAAFIDPAVVSTAMTSTTSLAAPAVIAGILSYPGLKALTARSANGQLHDSSGALKATTGLGSSVEGSIGVYAELRIPSMAERKITQGLACPAGFFGFGGAARSSTDASEYESTSPVRCVAPHGSIPVDQQVIAWDLKSPQTGYVRLVCELAEGSDSLSIKVAADAATPLGPTDSSCTP